MQILNHRIDCTNKPIAGRTFLIVGMFFILMFGFQFIAMAQLLPSSTKIYALRLKPGQDIKLELDNLVKEKGWKAVSVVTCVGSLDKAMLRFANQKEGTEVAGKLEIVSMTGVLSIAGSHLHLAVSDSTGKTTGGHLLQGCVVYTTAEIVLAILTDYTFDRVLDPTYGYKELEVK